MRLGIHLLATVFAVAGFRAYAAPASCDSTTLATLREAASTCDCTGSATHGAYVKCAVAAIKTAAKGSGAPKVCEHEAKKCVAKSSCGKSGAVACVVTNAAGNGKCTIKKDATACKAPKGGTACAATEPSCCDATCGG